ncbi:MAG: IS4 family transposase [Betaproteobacteria bacterium]|nr:IS4 family transposase [Betaproteobacteria bacterium]
MKDSKVERARQKAMMFGRQFLQGDAGVFDQALGADAMAAAISTQAPGCRERIYGPLDTLRLFVGQVLSADRACQDVVGRRLSERIAQGQSESALTTGSYCDARQRLPLAMPIALGNALGAQLELRAPAHWRWQGRSIKLFDGTIVSMPDTPSNQTAYPQSREQKPGLGFPIARIGALIGLASGAMLGYQVVACEGKGVGEQTLLGNLLDHLNAGDVLLADALLATWWIIEGAIRRRADVVMAQHGKRITDFTRGRRLGENDHIVQWPRPPKPKAMSAAAYAHYPAFITMREVEVNGRILVTTLLDPKIVSPGALASLYKMRWNIEVDFRTIKATLEMDVLRCKSQPMVEKEIAVYFLAYNLVRWAMAKAALLADILPRVLSFTGAKRLLSAFADQLRRTSGDGIRNLIATVLRLIATLRLPHRPDRIEPRAKKRRPKNLPLLNVPRQVARDLILAQRTLNRVP